MSSPGKAANGCTKQVSWPNRLINPFHVLRDFTTSPVLKVLLLYL